MVASFRLIWVCLVLGALSPFTAPDRIGGLDDCNASGTDDGDCGSVCNNATYVQAGSCLDGADRDTALYQDDQSTQPCGTNSYGGQSCSSIKDAETQAEGCVSQPCPGGGL